MKKKLRVNSFFTWKYFFFRRLVCFILSLCILLPAAACGEGISAEEVEGKPHMDLDVYTIHAEDDGSVDVIVTVGWVNGDDGKIIEKLKHVTVTAKGTNGLKVQYFWEQNPEKPDIEGNTYELGDLKDPYTFAIHCKYDDPDGYTHPPEEKPEIQIDIRCQNCWGISYKVPFDVQPQARVMLGTMGTPLFVPFLSDNLINCITPCQR